MKQRLSDEQKSFSLRQSSVAGDCENDTTRKKLHSARRIQSIKTIGRTKGKVFWKLRGFFYPFCARRENLPREREKIGKFLLDHQCWCTRTQRAALSSMKIYYLCVSSFLCENTFSFSAALLARWKSDEIDNKTKLKNNIGRSFSSSRRTFFLPGAEESQLFELVLRYFSKFKAVSDDNRQY